MRRETAPGVLQRCHQSVSTSRFVSEACSVMSGTCICYVAKFYSISKKVSCMQEKVALRSQCNMRTGEKITVDQNLRFQSVTQYLSALQSS